MKSFYTKRAKLVFLLPGFILFTLFVTYSIIPCFIMSLQNHNGATSLGWAGDLTNWGEVGAAVTITSLPVIVVFVLCNKQIEQAMVGTSGLK